MTVREGGCLCNCVRVRVGNSTVVYWRRRAQGCCLWVSYCTSSHHSDSFEGFVDPVFFSLFWVFHVNILCLCYLCVLSSVFLFVHIYLDLCIRIYTRVNRLWPVTFLTGKNFFLDCSVDRSNLVLRKLHLPNLLWMVSFELLKSVLHS